MGAHVNNNHKYGITLGSNKEEAYLMLNDFGGFKTSKNELLSIFNNENDKRTAEQLFDLFNTTKDEDGSEECIDNVELDKIGNKITDFANLLTKDSNLSDEEVLEFFKQNNITGSVSVLYKLVRYISVKDVAKDVTSTVLSMNGDNITLSAQKIKSDDNNNIYRLTPQTGIIDRIFNNKTYIASFNGKDPALKISASKTYARFLENPDLEEHAVVAQNRAIGTARAEYGNNNFDKMKKLALDILYGNISKGDEINYDNVFDTDGNGVKKTFSIIPNEIADLVNLNNYTKEEIINSLSIIAGLTDKEIDKMFDNDEEKYQYKSTFIKRWDFCKQLLSEMQIDTNNQDAIESFEHAKICVLEKQSSTLTDLRDINAYGQEIRKITNLSVRDSLKQAIEQKKAELLSTHKPLPNVDLKELISTLEKYGFDVEDPDNSGAVLASERIIQQYKHLLKSEKDTVYYLKNMRLRNILESVNKRLDVGIDVLADEETFVKYIIAEVNLTDLKWKIASFDYQTYMTMLSTFEIPMTEDNKEGIISYKSEDTYKYFHEMLKANSENGMQIVPDINSFLNLTNLVDYINKASTPYDATLYRGESYSLLENIELPDGSNLSDRMKKAKEALPDRTEIDKLIGAFGSLNDITITQPKLISTSARKNIAEDFARRKDGIIMNVNLPAGSKAICPDVIMFKSYDGLSEAEVLIQRGSDIIIQNLRFDDELSSWVVDCTVETK